MLSSHVDPLSRVLRTDEPLERFSVFWVTFPSAAPIVRSGPKPCIRLGPPRVTPPLAVSWDRAPLSWRPHTDRQGITDGAWADLSTPTHQHPRAESLVGLDRTESLGVCLVEGEGGPARPHPSLQSCHLKKLCQKRCHCAGGRISTNLWPWRDLLRDILIVPPWPADDDPMFASKKPLPPDVEAFIRRWIQTRVV